MKSLALITGASDGIGLELAHIHAARGGNLIVVARNTAKLEALKQTLEQTHGVSVHVITQDLALPHAAETLYQTVSGMGLNVDVLINNAGFGDYGFFAETSAEKEEKMIQLNITTLTQLCKLFIQDMKQRGAGRIMNVASTGAFQPAPTMAVYCATKSYVLSFTEAVNNELKGSGVTMTALCPGPTTTGFEKAAAMGESNLFKGPTVASAKSVAQYGYKAMMAGKVVAVHGWMNKLMVFSVRLVPRAMVVNIARMILKKAR